MQEEKTQWKAASSIHVPLSDEEWDLLYAIVGLDGGEPKDVLRRLLLDEGRRRGLLAGDQKDGDT